jgi:hypothetical protein
MVVAGGLSDAASLKSDAAPLTKGAATPPLNASLPAGPAWSTSQTDAAAQGASQSSFFPGMFVDGLPDAALLKFDATPSAKGAATPPRSEMPPIQVEPIQVEPIQVEPIQIEPIQIEPVQIEPVQTKNALAKGAPEVAHRATVDLPAAASAVNAPVLESQTLVANLVEANTLPEGPSTITAEQIGRPAGRYQLPVGNPFTTVRPAPAKFEVASPSIPGVTVALADQSGLSTRPTTVSRTRGQAEPPRATDAELQAKMNLAALPFAQIPAALLPSSPEAIEAQASTASPGARQSDLSTTDLSTTDSSTTDSSTTIESGAIQSHIADFNSGEPRQPLFPLRAATPIDASVRASAGSIGESAGLAFAARLVPIAATAHQTAPAAPSLQRAVTDAPARPIPATNPASVASVASESSDKGASAPMTPSGSVADHGGNSPSTSEQESKGGLPDRSRKTDQPQPIADELSQAAMGRVIPQTEYAPEPRVNTPGQPASSPTADSAHPMEAPALAPGTETAKAPGAARDIRLEIGGGDHRVEVRLMERGGEVHVAVRTPDTHLASTLREDLSALSSRLTESGFRTETWHPGASGATEWHRQADPSTAGTPQDPDHQPGQQGRDRQPNDRQPQQQNVPEEQLNQKQKGKDFKWFMSTLR